ncbi:MAG: transcriptional repressor [Actinobacteria bacterium]|nr:transcriptional repressor [Actinomycetota bacterium]MBO0784787.1 transcriptional repressor [Actinomycetota bacterium]
MISLAGGSRPLPGPAAAVPGGEDGFGRRTRQRRAVLRCLASHPGFVTAQALHARLRSGGEQVGLTTVYRALRALTTAGLLDTAHDPAEGQLFRIRPGHGQHGHQHYLICRTCRRSVTITSAAIERWAAAAGRRHGFTDVQHVIELTGVCGACQSHAEGVCEERIDEGTGPAGRGL